MKKRKTRRGKRRGTKERIRNKTVNLKKGGNEKTEKREGEKEKRNHQKG